MDSMGHGWRTLPPLYKKRVYQGAGAYLALLLALGGWVGINNHDAGALRQTAIPHVETDIRPVYLSPQLTDLSNPSFNLADVHSATQPGKIALIMTDLGLGRQTDERAISAMPAAVALAFSPYGKYSKADAAAAKADGHAVIALIPMEPTTYPKDDPGTLALLGRHSVGENQKNMTQIFAAIPSADGAMNFMGSRYLAAEQNAELVLKATQDKKIPFIEAPVSERSVVKSVASRRAAPYATVDIYIDDNATENDIRNQLSELERISRQRGIAVAVVHPFPLTFTLLDSWLSGLDERSLVLADLSEAVRLQAQAESAPAAHVLPASDSGVAPAPPIAPAVVGEQPPAEPRR